MLDLFRSISTKRGFQEQTYCLGGHREQQIKTIVTSSWRGPEIFTLRFEFNDEEAPENLVRILFMRGTQLQFEREMEVDLKVFICNVELFSL